MKNNKRVACRPLARSYQSMIVYQATKSDFLHHALRNDIDDVVARHVRDAGLGAGAPAEMRAWKVSLMEMAKVLMDDEIPADAGVAIEYQLPQTSKRIDFLITGEDAKRQSKVVIVELKQWSESRRSDKDAIVWARRGGRAGESEGPHPSYQAWTYAALLEDYNTAVQDGDLKLRPCAYLHNHSRDGQIDHPHYQEHTAKAPLFLKQEREKLQAFIRDHVRHGDKRGTLYAIENGRFRPSKRLVDTVVGQLQGKTEFVLIDDQKLVHETVLQVEARAHDGGPKQVVIVQGGPGTGKSVVAINLLAAFLERKRVTRYVSKNAAPRAVYESKLAGTFSKSRISHLFSGSGAFIGAEADLYGVLVVDEAHRLNEKSGLYRNLGDNQIAELIGAARCTVFFVDDDQLVTLQDIGHSDELKRHAVAAGAAITELTLTSQFRCNGSDGYLAWLDDVLGVRPTANPTLDTREYDFRVLDSPAELHDLITLKNRANNRSRVVAGYCWKWPSKKDPKAWDIEIPEFGYQRQWNLDKDSSLWIVAPDSVEQVGCIHTCQGLEVDYVGVIIGMDMRIADGRVQTDATQRASSDQSVRGLKKMLKDDPQRARTLADTIVKNTYRTLMTRGMKGCYVYCVDPELAAWFRARLLQREDAGVDMPPAAVEASGANAVDVSTLIPKSMPLRLVTKHERERGVPAAPLIDLKFAAGAFSDWQDFDHDDREWVELPEGRRAEPGLFVAQVVGESMNRRISNGSWCLFRMHPQGSRQGKVVVAQHRRISDPETGGRFTVKVYSSEKVASEDGGWRHTRVVLRPDTDRVGFEPIVIEVEEDDDGVAVIAEFVSCLA